MFQCHVDKRDPHSNYNSYYFYFILFLFIYDSGIPRKNKKTGMAEARAEINGHGPFSPVHDQDEKKKEVSQISMTFKKNIRTKNDVIPEMRTVSEVTQ